ncbi:MAG: 2OG-Fe dioxygenase family protein [Gammaproteobacteria bacterium]|nr:2OG-Fe dioxygenase family protein [Gammaproteobacteria bacterium]
MNTSDPALPLGDIVTGLDEQGFLFVESRHTKELLSSIAASAIGEEHAFLDSWNRLERDQYMADGGKYRKRRHATYAIHNAGEPAELMPYQPHYQTIDYNPLNGGVARYFAPILDDLHRSPTLAALLEFGNQIFSQVTANHQWHIELHQFRIEARDGKLGKPTPEGVHRDGVDFIIVVMIKRVNIDSGATTIFDLDNLLVGEFMLREAFDVALVNDRRVYHGVTPITQLDPLAEAYRDVLVITFKNKTFV